MTNKTFARRSVTGLTIAASMAIAALAFSGLAVAGDLAAKDEITGAVSGKTYQGSMLKDSFVEYYDADGSIKGKGYSGTWRATDQAMCFTYGDNPEVCWGLEINGPAVTLYKDGKVDGTGILIDGNPNKF